MRHRLALILAIAGKDWRLFWADRRAAAFAFLVPIVLASAFGIIFHRPSSGEGDVRLPIVVAMEEDGPFTRQVMNDVLASKRFEAREVSLAEAASSVAERRPGLAIVLPRGFERLKNWMPGGSSERPHVHLLHHPLSVAERQWAEGAFTEIAMKRLAREKLPNVIQDESANMLFRVSAETVAGVGQAKFNSYSHSFSGMTLQYLLFWGMESGLLFLRERQRSLWIRLRAAPLSLGDLILGKALATAAIALLQVFATFTFGHLVFGVTVSGSAIGFVLLALAISVLAAATGLLVAALGGTEARARSVCILVILGVSMLGGLWLPSFLLPGWVRDVALSLPTTWAMRGLDAVTWQGRGLMAVLPGVAAVFGFTIVFLAAAVSRLSLAEARRRGAA